METIKVRDKFFRPFISSDAIQNRISEMAEQINRDYEDKKPIFLAILNGSFILASDLIKQLHIAELSIHFVKLASYQQLQSTNAVNTCIGLDISLKDKDVIIIEDILDTGKTLHHFIHTDILPQKPASLKTLVLLHKPQATRYPIHLDYCGFKIENTFIIGYGFDYDGYGRQYNDIYQLTEE